mgnify:CR=1 FL=1
MDAFLELFSFEGRVNRAWYFWHILLDDLLIFTLVMALLVIGGLLGNPLVLLPMLGVVFGGIWAGLAITVKRFHDIDRPGWHWWLLLIPGYNLYLAAVLLFWPGTPGPNRFGRDPLLIGPASSHVDEL